MKKDTGTGKKKMSKGKRILCILLCIFVFFVLLIGTLLIILKVNTEDYYAGSEKAFRYPSIAEGFTPQGIAYDEKSDCFFLSGYQLGSEAAPIYVVRRSDGELAASAYMYKSDGTAFDGHGGGIAVWNDYVYVAGTYDGIYVFDRNEVLDAKDGAEVQSLGLMPVRVGEENVTSSFLTAHDDTLTVGEFRVPLMLPTPESHHFTSSSGEETMAVAVSYHLDKDVPLGIDPDAFEAYTLPVMAQGMCFWEDNIALSSDNTALFGSLYVFDSSDLEEVGTFGGVPVYALDISAQKARWFLPTFIEEIEYNDGQIYVVNESANNVFLFGKLFDADWCYSTSIGSDDSSFFQLR